MFEFKRDKQVPQMGTKICLNLEIRLQRQSTSQSQRQTRRSRVSDSESADERDEVMSL